ncbi:MAG: NADH-quinone oxidoreductase subunit NuoH [Thermoprotei archaeon]|nr:MAG: NADH-quinone oxidoreductase subunit NuoH [Thermoprotei archaeon]RLF18831.1 MAG: NADH-quinone oxidoreductase subunit NuoH [Thermoprotei archaeon]
MNLPISLPTLPNIPGLPPIPLPVLPPPFDVLIEFMQTSEFMEFAVELSLKLLVFPGLAFIMLYAMLAVWGERKLHARIHLRIGPYHVGPIFGLFQLVADGIKLLGKEIVTPERSHKFFYHLAPVLIMSLSMITLAFIPFFPVGPGEYWTIYYSEYSLLIILALFSLRPFIMIMAGWASNNKYTMMGAMRAAFQLLAYEVPLMLSMASVVILAGSFDLAKIVESQANMWFIVPCFLGFIVFFISTMAEICRRPLDIIVAEQEIVFGPWTEYTGMEYGLIMMSEYVDVAIASFLTSILFLGGWHGPGLHPLVWLLIKMGILSMFFMIGRSTWPRLRIDQLLDAGWRKLIPLALVQVFIAIVLVYVLKVIVV